MRSRATVGFAGASLWVLAATANAQSASTTAGAEDSAGFELEEIVVTARRKDESLQDVPTSINAVTGDDIEKLNIRKFEDIASVVPGLSMSTAANGLGGTASVRGIAYDVQASGNNGTVEFYLNDAPISAGNLFQTMYDIQQVELLRGPQGTLRGRASPSGSMTVATRRPDLQEMGGYGSVTATNIGGVNLQGAFGMPIISDVLAVRVAAAHDKNEGNRVKSVNNPNDPEVKANSGRITIRFEPTDTLSLALTYQKTKNEIATFDQVESQQVINPSASINPGAPGALIGPRFIRAEDRLSLMDTPRTVEQNFDNYNLQGQWAFAGQKLNYVGARNEQVMDSFESNDIGDFFPANYPAFLQNFGQVSHTDTHSTAHELRLSSEERIAGVLDYIVGAFYQKADAPTDVDRPTAVLFGAPSPSVGGFINHTLIQRRSNNTEKSAFANLTAQVGESTEVSVGLRHIKYHVEASLLINGARLAAADQNSDFSANIYSASVKHNFSDNLMAYASLGTSWRAGISVTGDFSIQRTPLENSFLILAPEESKSYEIGLKGSALDKRLRYGVSVYHQKFENYPYRSAAGVFFAETPAPGFTRLNRFNFVGAVPVEVNGVEADIAYAPTAQWDMSAVVSYSKGEIKDGLVPCNDYSPRDGVPDSTTSIPTVTDIRTATGGDNLSGCRVTQASSPAPEVSGSLQSEYRLPITDTLSSYVRGQMSLYGSSDNDPTNAVDDYDAYQLLNLYLGIRGGDGAWEVGVYGKNVTNTEEVTIRSDGVQTTAYNVGATANTGVTNYYGGTNVAGLGMTPPREFGLTVRYNFGAK